MATETRTLRTGPEVIFHLIESQAGTLAKAICESVSNGIDADAKSITITLTRKGCRIVDDGFGIRTRDEIEKCFETVGFTHDDRERRHGKFGLGRAQLWAFAATTWRTTTFQLDVNVKQRGLDYDLTSDLPMQPGLDIEASFYEERTEQEHQSDLRELAELVRYVEIPVWVNGKQVNTLPATAKWTQEDEDAYLKVTDGNHLQVYSQGVFVRSYYVSQVGVAGTLVTKVGHPLQLNVARNDVLTAKCELWKKLRSRLRKLADDKASTKTERLNDEQRDYLALRMRTDHPSPFVDKPIITLSDRRHLSIKDFLERLYQRHEGLALSTAEIGDQVAERAIKTKQALVLAPATLRRFAVESVTDFVTELARILRVPGTGYWGQWSLQTFLSRWKDLAVYDDFRSAPFGSTETHKVLTAAETSKEAKVVLSALNKVESVVRGAFREHVPSGVPNVRRLVAGESETADAWTDGATTIAIDHALLKDATKYGLKSVGKLILILVHEYLHDRSSAGSHLHDHDFYESFHDLVIDEGERLALATDWATRLIYKGLEKKSQTAAQRIDQLDQYAAIAPGAPSLSMEGEIPPNFAHTVLDACSDDA
jgi:hypothetical protein